ncbi:MAG: RNA polymerase subunit sigma-24 [Armatimonadetes bacterium CG_4_10_14_3_um_filter_66_18]|nr:sigma-70 family RNA polymerase sigma factor [Armatimonadota bacterium]PIU92969.1 MAG: RNA polymerase subunit sigma-24 [Armatimonadetes bacterium CG06_land_8_20_14_3_00_66_21]PIX42574.1 MAG: RNA polymerase subunit sigma-24 [Armatimonadetes bacterium CG_4_8_14_3_um_filter_66_20]PIY36583.1 MAG: RNA polymerase subunit sigma-24 [Armatimonadetes bacterium CG_4_10_14_3_um_filter_66_18]PIZ48082.1 MAG: RNA polymerase subunit sigma-24 [Armatimonadetes bacterium CG_4_10_14_0_8_um_filter_66_14]PJB67783
MKPRSAVPCTDSQNRFLQPMALSWQALISDAALAQRCLSGEGAAFDELVRRHRDRIYSLCYRMCGNADRANDLAQEAFVRAYERLDRYDPGRPFGPWLTQLTVNSCLNLLRDDRREDDHDPLSEEWEEWHPVEARSVARQVMDREIDSALEEAVLSLPPRYRAVAVLRYLEDSSYEEIAGTLGLPVGTVKVQLFRAREQLRELLRGVVDSDMP